MINSVFFFSISLNCSELNSYRPFQAIPILAASGADLELRSEFPTQLCTPIFAAANFGHHDAVKELIKAGADMNAKDDIYGDTALIIATYFRHRKTVR